MTLTRKAPKLLLPKVVQLPTVVQINGLATALFRRILQADVPEARAEQSQPAVDEPLAANVQMRLRFLRAGDGAGTAALIAHRCHDDVQHRQDVMRHPGERRHPIRSVRLRQRGGVFHAEELQGWHRHWREPYRFMLAIPWPGFLLGIAASYLLLNLAFTLLFTLDLGGIGGAPMGQRASLLEAFFFSVQTLGSIGYGVLHPTSLWVNLVVTVEAFFGLLFIAVTTGLAFARFSRSRARLRFSRVATIEPWQGHPTLTFRVANVRQNSLVDGRIRASLAMDEESGSGMMRRLVPLPLVRDQSISFQLMWTVMHRIDRHSPFFGLSRKDLERRHAEVLVAFQGLDEILLTPVHFRCSYGVADLRFEEQFRDMVKMDDPDSIFLDFSCFDETDPLESPARPDAPGHGEGGDQSPDPPAPPPWG